MEGFLVGEGSDGVGGELEGSVVLGLFQEYYLDVSVVEPPDHHDFIINHCSRHVH